MVNLIYRSTKGHDYHFDIDPGRGNHRIYILDQPPYPAGRKTDGHSTHRYGIGTPPPYICWSGTIPSLDQAKTIAASWAECTDTYIATATFPEEIFRDWKDLDELRATASLPPASGTRPRPHTPARPQPSTDISPTRMPARLPLRVRLRERVIR